MRPALAALLLSAVALPALADVDVGPRPGYLVDLLPEGPLKTRLEACIGQPMTPRQFSIGHRGAPLMFPEHTVESNRAAARMGAGVLECDVTFTKDKELVCRHAQNDLQTSTDILATPLAATCVQPFTPASGDRPAAAECRASDVTLAEFRTLQGKMDGGDKKAATVEDYMQGSPRWRTDLYAPGTLMTHRESIELFKSLGAKFTPELKEASVEMPYEGMTQEMYAQKMIDEYKAAGVPASDVFAQSFHLEDILYWIKAEPDFGKQAVYLIDPDELPGFDNMKPETWGHDMADLKARGVNYIAPPLFVLVTNDDGRIVPSAYAKAARDAGLQIITWSLERSGPLAQGGGWYYASINDIVHSDAAILQLLDVLAQQVGVAGVFSDWPGTVTFYANCMDLN